MTDNKKCKHCSLGYEPHFVDGVWSHGLPGGRYVCSRRQEAERMKVFRVLITFPTQPRIPRIEMTILDSNQAEVGATVRGILEAEGYDAGAATMTSSEIEGPFETGVV